MFRCLGIFGFLLLFIPAKAFTVVTFQPDSVCGKDAVVASFWPDAPHGAHPDFIACAWTYQGNPSSTRALVSFDLATIPTGATIILATLELYHYPSPYNTGHSNLSGPASCWLQRITQPWSENGVTWNNQPATTTLNQSNIAAPTSATQNYSITVTSLIQDMINDPANSFGFMLRQQNESYYRSMLFASSDMSNPALRPRLTITYSLDQLPSAGCWTNAYMSNPNPPPTPSAPDPVVHMPNVFTPNGDGINDTFFADSVNYTVNEFLIYDRWGVLVFTSSPGRAWDGRFNEKECADGTYYYVFRYSNGGNVMSLAGFLTLIR